MSVLGLRRWIRRGHSRPLRRPVADLWLGGPNADGRGLDAANGGFNPASGLAITSPTSSTPASTARCLIPDATGVWRDKDEGVLGGIGGRVWTGSGWTYAGATNVTCLGPLPALSTHGITDTVRRYSSTTGLTCSDAVGGLVQSYSRRCDVEAGYAGGGWSVWPIETVSSVASGGTVYWHGLVEAADPSLFAPLFGAYDGSSFFDGNPSIGQLSAVGAGSSGQFRWNKRHLGTGPNGGTLVEYWVRQELTQSKTNVTLRAYLLYAASGTPARTLYIHQHAAHYTVSHAAKLFGYLPLHLVAAGSVASLTAENLFLNDLPQANATVIMRLDFTDRAFDYKGYRLWAYKANSTYTPLHLTGDTIGMYPPVIASGSVLTQAKTTAGSVVDGNRFVKLYHNGVVCASGQMDTPTPTTPGLQFGQGVTDRLALTPILRLVAWHRALSAAEVAAAHAAIVAAEG